MFPHGLADHIKKELFLLDLPTDLDGLIALAIRVDTCLLQRNQQVSRLSVPSTTDISVPLSSDAVSPNYDPEPMQVGRS